MTRALVNAHAATLPGTTHSDPWGGGHDAWKVGGKLFAVVRVSEENGVSVKCADVETAALLTLMGRAMPAPYFHKSWVRIPWDLVGVEELRERITLSYGLILRGLPKKVQPLLKP